MADTVSSVKYSLHPFRNVPLTEHFDQGLAGWLVMPGGEREQQIENELWQLIKDRGVEPAVRENFHVTSPLWYGFWIDSPLTREQSSILHELLSEIEMSSAWHKKELEQFLRTLKTAVDNDRPLYVKSSPPGHCDIGWSTTFVHCPRCKAEGPFPHWQRSYPKEPFKCRVCGHEYVPVDTYSSRRDYFGCKSCCTSCQKQVLLRDLWELYSDEDYATLQEHLEHAQLTSYIQTLRRVSQLRSSLFEKYPRLRTIYQSGCGYLLTFLKVSCFRLWQRWKGNWSKDDSDTLSEVYFAWPNLQERIERITEQIKKLQPGLRSNPLICPYCRTGRLQISFDRRERLG
jgi:hypothetical protein